MSKILINTKDSVSKAAILLCQLVVALGILIRIKVYVQNRSLFIDEANLGRALIESGYWDFFSVLEYQQFAPPLFMIESKLVVQIFGNFEWALRLIPFLAGLATIWMLWKALEEFIGNPVIRLYGLSLFCFSFLAIRYGTEFKQYSTDAFFATAFLLWAWRDKIGEWTTGRTLKWIALGAIGVWYSMPSVFILSGVGLFLLSIYRKTAVVQIIGLISVWLLSFLLYYYFVLRYNIGTEYLEGYFEDYFLKANSLTSAAWANNFRLFSDLIRNVTDKTAVSISFGILVFLCGIYHLVRYDRAKALLVLVPISSLLVASVLHYYALIARLTLFISPCIIIVMCIGVDQLWKASGRWGPYLLSLLMLLGIVNKSGWDYFIEKMTFEEVKPCLSLLAQQSDSKDQVYIDYEASPAYVFYTEHYANKFKITGNVDLGQWNSDPLKDYNPGREGRLWVLYAHAEEARIAKAELRLAIQGSVVRCASHRVRLLVIE